MKTRKIRILILLMLIVVCLLLLPLLQPIRKEEADDAHTAISEIEETSGTQSDNLVSPAPPLKDDGDPLTDEPEEIRVPLEAYPIRMYIPALNVDAEIQDTGTDYARNTMYIVDSGSIMSWWRESAIPGNEGNAIFGSHNRWNGVNGQLHDLDTLNIGDEMEILYEDDTSMVFKLESVFVYLLATAPADVIMDITGDARVTLITCKAPFNPNTGTSDNRIIAIFKPEEDFIIPDPPIEPFPLRPAR